MNRVILTAWAFVVATCTPVMALAAEVPIVDDAGREMGENVATRPVWLTALILLTWLAVKAWKHPALPGWISPRWRPVAAFGIAILGGVTESLIRSRSSDAFFEGLQNGILAGFGAIGLQELGMRSLANGKGDAGGPKPEPPTTPPPTIATMALLCLALMGCAGTSPLVAGAEAHKHATKTVDAAAPILREKCVEPMQRAAALEDATARRDAAVKVATRCDVPVASYEQARTAVVVLGAALTAAATGDLSRLPAAVASAGEAAVKLAMAIAEVSK